MTDVAAISDNKVVREFVMAASSHPVKSPIVNTSELTGGSLK